MSIDAKRAYERITSLQRLQKDRARYVGMMEAACVIHETFGPWGPLRRWSGSYQAYRAVQDAALGLVEDIARREREYREVYEREEEASDAQEG